MKEKISFLVAFLCLVSISAFGQSNALNVHGFNHYSMTNFVPATFDNYMVDGYSSDVFEYSGFSTGNSTKRGSGMIELHTITSVFPDPIERGQAMYISPEHLDGATRMEMITIYGKLIKTLDPNNNKFSMPEDLSYGTYFVSVYREDVINNFMIIVD